MMKKQIEIEIRGGLSSSQFTRLRSMLAEKGNETKHYLRTSVDISPGFDIISRTWKTDDSEDLRVKKSGDTEKISLKLGEYSGMERQEVEVYLKEGEMSKAVQLFDLLGFNKGLIYHWESWEYEYKQYEVKLTKMSDDYFEWEIESKDGKIDPHILAVELGLTPFTESEFKKRIDWQNQNIHQLYSLQTLKNVLNSIKNDKK